MAPITTTTEINKTPEEVFAYVTDPTHFAEWQRNVVGGHMDIDGPTTVGTRSLTTRRIGFAERAVTSEVTHISPPRTWGVRGVDGPIRATVNVTVDPIQDTCPGKALPSARCVRLGPCRIGPPRSLAMLRPLPITSSAPGSTTSGTWRRVTSRRSTHPHGTWRFRAWWTWWAGCQRRGLSTSPVAPVS